MAAGQILDKLGVATGFVGLAAFVAISGLPVLFLAYKNIRPIKAEVPPAEPLDSKSEKMDV